MTENTKLTGLTDAQVAESRLQHGMNVLTPPPPTPWWREFLKKFSDPLIVILCVAGVLSVGISLYEYYGLGENWMVFFEPIGIFMAIFMATGLAFIFENRANKAFAILNKVNDDAPVEVMRNGSTTRVPRKDVVVGDIVYVNTGDEIPADGRLIDSVTLSVDESSLTGEPMCAKTHIREHFDSEATYPSDVLLRGTKAMEGHGLMEVTRVGDATEAGKVFVESQIDDSVHTPLNEKLDRLARLISDASYLVAALVIVGQTVHFLGWGNLMSYLPIVPVALFFYLLIKKFPGWTKSRCTMGIVVSFALFIGAVILSYSVITPSADTAMWSQLLSHTLRILMVAVTLIVVAVPEGLPMAVTLSLAYSMSRMLKTNNLVRKMHACETMGAATVICTDKTGTLTQNRMTVYETHFFDDTPQDIIDEGIALNSTARLDDSEGQTQVVGNPTEGALILWLRDHKVDYLAVREACRRVAEIPFTTERKYMATAVVSPDGHTRLYVKGAPEIVMGMCRDIPENDMREANALLAGFQSMAMRTLGLAYMDMGDTKDSLTEGEIPAGKLTFIGIIAISDPVREDVADAIRTVTDAGIAVKIVTGDTPGTAKEIGRQIGLWNDDTDNADNIATGPEIAGMSDNQLRRRVEKLKIIARARPLDKKRLVEALQADGEVVAVTGDGTNDAPALKTAQVGLSMGDGTAVAKEASDITIIDNSFASIGRAVMWGRSLYKNIQRFLLFQLTVNVAACLLVLVGSFIGAESPLSVTQMLWVNLIMDTFGAMALASLPPSPSVMKDKPRNRNASILTRPMLTELFSIGFVLFAITLAFFWVFTHADVTSLYSITSVHLGAEHTMTTYEATLLFSIFVWTHFWYMFDARCFDTGKSIFRVKMSGGFWTIVLIIVVGQLMITELFYEFFNVAPMIHTADWHFNSTGTCDLATIIVASSLVLWIREAYRAIRVGEGQQSKHS